MKRTILFLLFVYSSSVSLAVVNYADEEIKEDIQLIAQKFEMVQDLISRLSSSDINYIICYEDIGEMVDGKLETDGENIFIKLKEYGLYSLQAKFVHEVTHALQFEAGKIAFFKNKLGKWSTLNLDIWDEAEAFLMMTLVDNGFESNPKLVSKKSTLLIHFKKDLEYNGFESAAKLLNSFYQSVSYEHQNNPELGPKLMKNGKVFYKLFNSTFDYLAMFSDENDKKRI